MTTQRYTNTSHVGPVGHTAKCIVKPETIGAMSVHYPIIFYPGYKLYQLSPEEGVVRLFFESLTLIYEIQISLTTWRLWWFRHYRDQTLGNFGKIWINTVLQFGSFEETKLEENLSKQLVKAVVKRVKYVYENNNDAD